MRYLRRAILAANYLLRFEPVVVECLVLTHAVGPVCESLFDLSRCHTHKRLLFTLSWHVPFMIFHQPKAICGSALEHGRAYCCGAASPFASPISRKCSTPSIVMKCMMMQFQVCGSCLLTDTHNSGAVLTAYITVICSPVLEQVGACRGCQPSTA